MTWTRLSDNYTDRPKFEDMSLSACYLDVEALVYCNRLLTDGFLPARKLPRITRSDDPEADMQELIDSGIWWEVEGGYQREWDDQMLATDVERSRADNPSVRGDLMRASVTEKHDTLLAITLNASLNIAQVLGERLRATLLTRYLTHPRPDPTRPDPKGRGRGRLRLRALRGARLRHGKKPMLRWCLNLTLMMSVWISTFWPGDDP